MTALHKAEIKQLRSDARKLETVAKHLREQARSLAAEQRAEETRASFMSKRSKVDPDLIITPEPFMEEVNNAH